MVFILRKTATRQEIDTLKKEVYNLQVSRQGVDTNKYCGIIRLQQEPMAIQKQMRDEWE